MNKVITINNIELPKNKCRKFNDNWYKIGDNKVKDSGDCYLINGRYYRIETGFIIFDHELNEYVVKTTDIKKGIIGFNDEVPVFDYFTLTNKNVMVHTINGHYMCLNENVINKAYYREHIMSGEFYHISLLRAKDFNKIVLPKKEYKYSLDYDSKKNLQHHIDKYNQNDIKIYPNVEKYSSVLKDYTFGIEFETTKGMLSENSLNKLDLIPLRDGSISGIEYVTPPMSGAKGLQSLINSCKELDKRTEYDDTCSLHIHIGNIPRTKEFILSFLLLTCKLQDEIFEMFPIYKKYNYGVKNKNYAAPYPVFDLLKNMDKTITKDNLDANFDVFFQYLTGGYSFRDYDYNLDNVKTHPNDPNDNQKWNVFSRYHIHNIASLIFGNKKTIEFRIHTPTFDHDKIIYFLIINVLMIDFTINSEWNILNRNKFLNNINLRYIIDCYLTQNNSKLLNLVTQYISTRKNVKQDLFRRGKTSFNEEDIRLPSHKKIKWLEENIEDQKNNIKTIDFNFSYWKNLYNNEIENMMVQVNNEAVNGNGIGIVQQLENLDNNG